jgi:hypothetical protein
MSTLTAEMAAVVDSAVRAMLASAPDNTGWESGLSAVIACLRLASVLPPALLWTRHSGRGDLSHCPGSGRACAPHPRQAHHEQSRVPAVGRQARGGGVGLLDRHWEPAPSVQQIWEDENSEESEDEIWEEQVAALQGERILLEPSAADSSSSSFSSSSSASSPALLSTLLPLQPPFLVYFQGNLDWDRRLRQVRYIKQPASAAQLCEVLRTEQRSEQALPPQQLDLV